MKLKHLFTTLGLSLLASTALADNCAVDLSANDAMRYDKNEIAVDKTCKQFTVNFSHTGKLAKNVMGHNVVITKKDDSREVASEGAAAGPEKDYLKADDPRIIAHTKIIGGGENTSVTFDVSKLNENDAYMFFCSFPGHIALMQGAVTLK